ncbi:MAG: DUF3987 domain-containing protein [Ferrovum sp.]|nr:DUF3987 domain-containing protein [Ferrovum sp.]
MSTKKTEASGEAGDRGNTQNTQVDHTSVLDFAQRYASLGWPVFPLVPGEKRPATANGYKDATTDPQKITTMFEPGQNLGIATGAAFWVLDVDCKNGALGFQSLKELKAKYGELPETLTATTPSGGKHFFFQSVPGMRNGINIKPGLDVRGDGGYVAAEPSQVGGKFYGFIDWDHTTGEIPEIADAPQWLIDLCLPKGKRTDVAPPQAGVEYVPEATIQELRDALKHLSAENYDTWINNGQRLKGLGDAGRALWDEWSQKSHKYDPAIQAEKWVTFHPDRTGYRAIFAEAQRQGWINPLAGGCSGHWPHPQLLTAKIDPEPYPIDALPRTIKDAVDEVVGFVKAPVAMVASSALAALSLAAQSHGDVKRAEKLTGPTGLFLLTIAESGERKSTCDGFFTQVIKDYEDAQAEAHRPILKKYDADVKSWESKYSGIRDKIRQQAKEKKPTTAEEAALRELEQDKPEPPRIPRLLYSDITPEEQAYSLAKKWPSGGVVSAEAGIVFGSHGMGKDSVMRNLGLLNQLWDGGTVQIDRRTSESFKVKGARLTMALQVQEATIRDFLDRSGELARGTGFLARFLVAWPQSTQGLRPFTESPANWPRLAEFNRRIAALLERPAPVDEDGALTPPMLTMTREAKAAWVDFHNEIEGELASGGELADVRDVASKSADNAARMAALFQMFEGGGAISLAAFESASAIVAWHLYESRRFFGELALPPELADAGRVDAWLIEYCRQQKTAIVGKNHLRQYGPLRDGARLDSAIKELTDLDRVAVAKEGKRILILLNPALLSEGGKA